jgi:uncharacterized protein YijF (DUF1287 family)
MKTRKLNLKLLSGILVIGLILYLFVFLPGNLRASKTAFMIEWDFDYPEHISTGGNFRSEAFGERLSYAAIKRTKADVKYDGSYFKISYPGGDVPGNVGVCTDVLIRAYRTLGFKTYPNLWGLKSPDTNIDHRRVPNLMVFFSRKGVVLPVTDNPEDYLPGDIVAWNTFGLTHIGIVINKLSPHKKRYMIVHNFGSGTKIEDFLFSYEIIGHFRYEG